MNNFKLDDIVWFQPNDERDKGFEAKIIKVGRKYYTIKRNYSTYTINIEDNYRIDYPSGKIYKSKKDADDFRQAKLLWLHLKGMYHINPTIEQVRKIYEILGLELKA